MAKLDPTLWRDMMEYLRRRHAPICRQWFEELHPVSLDSGLLKIHTISNVQQNYLQRKCIEQFQEAAQATTGALVAVRFVNEPDDGPAGANGRQGPTSRYTGEERRVNREPHRMSSASSTATAVLDSEQATGAGGGTVHFDQIVISPDYSFENFVPGPGNQLAYAAAVAVANQPGTAYNPLFIHGGVGLGKTHLLQAICQTHPQEPAPKCASATCPATASMNQFMDCVQRGLMNEFRHRYRHVDVLVIDDIHFLAHKERSQEAILPYLQRALSIQPAGSVLSSDSPPADIRSLKSARSAGSNGAWSPTSRARTTRRAWPSCGRKPNCAGWNCPTT